MKKTVLKEIIIILLLSLAIVLILGVLFYDYIPNNKIVPNKVSYQAPENVTQELLGDVDNGTFVNITYQLDDTQIDVSKKNKEYDPGKQNPFEGITTTQTAEGNQSNTANANTTSNAGSQTAGGNTNQNTTQNPNVNPVQGPSTTNAQENTTSYLPDGGTK